MRNNFQLTATPHFSKGFWRGSLLACSYSVWMASTRDDGKNSVNKLQKKRTLSDLSSWFNNSLKNSAKKKRDSKRQKERLLGSGCTIL